MSIENRDKASYDADMASNSTIEAPRKTDETSHKAVWASCNADKTICKEAVATKNIPTNGLRAWVLACRPKTLTAALIPVITAGAIAMRVEGWHWQAWVVCILFASLMQIASNLINDFFDFQKGTDGDDRLGPERATASGWITPRAMKGGIVVNIVLACMVGSLVLLPDTGIKPQEAVDGRFWMLVVGAGCVLFAFLYTTVLSYYGLGDVLVLLFFGLVPSVGTVFVMTGVVNAEAVINGFICGILIDTLLILNNYRDRDTDRNSGKLTLIARFGESFGERFYCACGLLAWGLTFLFIKTMGVWPTVITIPYLFLHLATWRRMCRIRKGKELNIILGLTSRNMMIFGILLTLGVLLCRIG